MNTSSPQKGLAGRQRARDRRLEAARQRRLELDPEKVARERRIDEAAVEFELALEERAAKQGEVLVAEQRAARALHELSGANLTSKEVMHLTGIDVVTFRRLRSLDVGTG